MNLHLLFGCLVGYGIAPFILRPYVAGAELIFRISLIAIGLAGFAWLHRRKKMN